jgi:hypothetical protein
VTSSGIGKLRKEIDDTVTKPIEKLKTGMNETTLGASGGFMGFAGWGVLGSVFFGLHYNSVQDDARAVLSQAVDTLHQWDPALATVQRNWRNAEDASTAVYQ